MTEMGTWGVELVVGRPLVFWTHPSGERVYTEERVAELFKKDYKPSGLRPQKTVHRRKTAKQVKREAFLRRQTRVRKVVEPASDLEGYHNPTPGLCLRKAICALLAQVIPENHIAASRILRCAEHLNKVTSGRGACYADRYDRAEAWIEVLKKAGAASDGDIILKTKDSLGRIYHAYAKHSLPKRRVQMGLIHALITDLFSAEFVRPVDYSGILIAGHDCGSSKCENWLMGRDKSQLVLRVVEIEGHECSIIFSRAKNAPTMIDKDLSSYKGRIPPIKIEANWSGWDFSLCETHLSATRPKIAEIRKIIVTNVVLTHTVGDLVAENRATSIEPVGQPRFIIRSTRDCSEISHLPAFEAVWRFNSLRYRWEYSDRTGPMNHDFLTVDVERCTKSYHNGHTWIHFTQWYRDREGYRGVFTIQKAAEFRGRRVLNWGYSDLDKEALGPYDFDIIDRQHEFDSSFKKGSHAWAVESGLYRDFFIQPDDFKKDKHRYWCLRDASSRALQYPWYVYQFIDHVICLATMSSHASVGGLSHQLPSEEMIPTDFFSPTHVKIAAKSRSPSNCVIEKTEFFADFSRLDQAYLDAGSELSFSSFALDSHQDRWFNEFIFRTTTFDDDSIAGDYDSSMRNAGVLAGGGVMFRTAGNQEFYDETTRILELLETERNPKKRFALRSEIGAEADAYFKAKRYFDRNHKITMTKPNRPEIDILPPIEDVFQPQPLLPTSSGEVLLDYQFHMNALDVLYVSGFGFYKIDRLNENQGDNLFCEWTLPVQESSSATSSDSSSDSNHSEYESYSETESDRPKTESSSSHSISSYTSYCADRDPCFDLEYSVGARCHVEGAVELDHASLKKAVEFDSFKQGTIYSMPDGHCYFYAELVARYLDGTISREAAVDILDSARQLLSTAPPVASFPSHNVRTLSVEHPSVANHRIAVYSGHAFYVYDVQRHPYSTFHGVSFSDPRAQGLVMMVPKPAREESDLHPLTEEVASERQGRAKPIWKEKKNKRGAKVKCAKKLNQALKGVAQAVSNKPESSSRQPEDAKPKPGLCFRDYQLSQLALDLLFGRKRTTLADSLDWNQWLLDTFLLPASWYYPCPDADFPDKYAKYFVIRVSKMGLLDHLSDVTFPDKPEYTLQKPYKKQLHTVLSRRRHLPSRPSVPVGSKTSAAQPTKNLDEPKGRLDAFFPLSKEIHFANIVAQVEPRAPPKYTKVDAYKGKTRTLRFEVFTESNSRLKTGRFVRQVYKTAGVDTWMIDFLRQAGKATSGNISDLTYTDSAHSGHPNSRLANDLTRMEASSRTDVYLSNAYQTTDDIPVYVSFGSKYSEVDDFANAYNAFIRTNAHPTLEFTTIGQLQDDIHKRDSQFFNQLHREWLRVNREIVWREEDYEAKYMTLKTNATYAAQCYYANSKKNEIQICEMELRPRIGEKWTKEQVVEQMGGAGFFDRDYTTETFNEGSYSEDYRCDLEQLQRDIADCRQAHPDHEYLRIICGLLLAISRLGNYRSFDELKEDRQAFRFLTGPQAKIFLVRMLRWFLRDRENGEETESARTVTRHLFTTGVGYTLFNRAWTYWKSIQDSYQNQTLKLALRSFGASDRFLDGQSTENLLAAMHYMLVRPIHYLAVRPNDDGYDKTYHESLKTYSLELSKSREEDGRLVLFTLSCEYAQNSDQYLSLYRLPSRAVAVELNDVAYYLPYFKFPTDSWVSLTQWEYPSVPTTEPAPFGEGRIDVRRKPFQRLHDLIRSYPPALRDVNSYFQDWGLFYDADFDFDSLNQSLVQNYDSIYGPGEAVNQPTGANRAYVGWNVLITGCDNVLPVGMHKLTSYTGVACSVSIRVKSNALRRRGCNFSLYDLARRRMFHGAILTDNVNRIVLDTNSSKEAFDSYFTEYQEKLEDIYDFFNHRRRQADMYRVLSLISWRNFGRAADGLFVKKAGWFSKAIVLSLDTVADDLPFSFFKQFWASAHSRIQDFFDDHFRGFAPQPYSTVRVLTVPDYLQYTLVGDSDAVKYASLYQRFLRSPTEIREWRNMKPKEQKREFKEELQAKKQTSKPKDDRDEGIKEPDVVYTYHTKPTNAEAILPTEHRVLPLQLNPDYQVKRQALIDWTVRRQLELPRHPRTRRAYKTGYDVYKNGKRVVPYEFDSKEKLNLIYAAFGRQLGSRNSPSAIHLHLYSLMMDDFFKWLDDKLRTYDWSALSFKEPLEWIVDHTEWTVEKKCSYAVNIMNHIMAEDLKPFQGAFDVMVKSGEQYLVEEEKTAFNLMEGVSERSRGISNPSSHFCGLATYVQSALVFPVLKKILPGFVHGVSCHDFTEKIRNDTKHFGLESSRAVSFDGSGFDSNQHVEIQKIADAGLFKAFKPYLEPFLRRVASFRGVQDFSVVIRGLEHTWTSFTSDWFLLVPGISDFYDNSKDCHSYFKFFKKRTNDAVKFTLQGTTFSGHPTMTTLGNTIRSLSYMWYVFWSLNVNEPWSENPHCHCMAAGDDSVFFVHERLLPFVLDQLKQVFVPDKQTPDAGLGQCIDKYTIFVNPFWNFDFCSKWCFYDGKDWYVTRDYSKLLWNKQQYEGECDAFKRKPYLHALAISQALTAEGVSGNFLSKIMDHRVSFYDSSLRQKAYDVWIADHSWAIHYQQTLLPASVLRLIDERLGLTESRYAYAATTNRLDLYDAV